MKRFPAFVLFVFLAGPAHAEVLYEAINLVETFERAMPGAELVDTWGVRAIAGDGTVLATGRAAGSITESLFLWHETSGDVVMLPELSGTRTHTAHMSSSGIIVGTTSAEGTISPYMWTADSGFQLLPEPEGVIGSTPRAVNDAGTVVGAFTFPFTILNFPPSELNAWRSVAGMWRNGSCMELGILEGGGTSMRLYYSGANAINNSGQVVGGSDSDNGGRGFLWDEQNGMQRLPDLPDEETWASEAFDINDAGQIAGRSCLFGDDGETLFRATLWTNGLAIDLHDLLPASRWSSACAVNSSGQVLGDVEFRVDDIAGTDPDGTTSEETFRDVFLWDEEHGMRLISDLITTDLDWISLFAVDIHDDGTILCYATQQLPDGRVSELRPYLLKPVPEPATLLLLAVAVGACLGSRTRRHV